MSWDPRVNVFDETQVKENLISYFQANQADALIWANGGTALPEIKKFHRSPQLVTVFPALTFLQTSHRSEFEDLISINLALVFECAIIHGNQDELASRSPKYSMALESMIVNMPETTLLKNSIIEPSAFSIGLETTFDIQGKYKNQFIQVFQVRAGWKITAAAYS